MEQQQQSGLICLANVDLFLSHAFSSSSHSSAYLFRKVFVIFSLLLLIIVLLDRRWLILPAQLSFRLSCYECTYVRIRILSAQPVDRTSIYLSVQWSDNLVKVLEVQQQHAWPASQPASQPLLPCLPGWPNTSKYFNKSVQQLKSSKLMLLFSFWQL